MRILDKETVELNREYLKLLSEKYPNAISCMAELVRLRAMLKLPKATEHFLSDIHGEYETFEHVIRSSSGNIRRRASEVIGPESDSALRLPTEEELNEFCTLVFYPEEKLKRLKQAGRANNSFYRLTILRLVKLFEVVSRKYAQSKVEKAISIEYSFIMRELVFRNPNQRDREGFYAEIVEAIVDIGFSENVIIEFCSSIKRLIVDRLHILGDIYDRGRGPHYIMDTLAAHHAVDIQWGNHDILWMGAAAGNLACIANAVRICMRYANTNVLERGYGINLYPLFQFADNNYSDSEDELKNFMPIESDEISDIDNIHLAKMQKAISIIQFKLEKKLIQRNKSFGMQDRVIIDTIEFDTGLAMLNGKQYKLNSSDFPTMVGDLPCELTDEEASVINGLQTSFLLSEKLQRHAQFLLSHGSVYLVYNNNLLMHAGLPMNDDLSFKKVSLFGETKSGKRFLDYIDETVRNSYSNNDDFHKDVFWHLWCSEDSPLFGKDKMATFERYFFDDKETHKEISPVFYEMIDDERLAIKVLEEFGLDPKTAHIICGHVPVKSGESPMKANKKIICIDLGYSKSYQKETGLAGCTLTYNSIGLTLMLHEHAASPANVLEADTDITDKLINVEELGIEKRLHVSDTEDSIQIEKDIINLEMLLFGFKHGIIAEE